MKSEAAKDEKRIKVVSQISSIAHCFETFGLRGAKPIFSEYDNLKEIGKQAFLCLDDQHLRSQSSTTTMTKERWVKTVAEALQNANPFVLTDCVLYLKQEVSHDDEVLKIFMGHVVREMTKALVSKNSKLKAHARTIFEGCLDDMVSYVPAESIEAIVTGMILNPKNKIVVTNEQYTGKQVKEVDKNIVFGEDFVYKRVQNPNTFKDTYMDYTRDFINMDSVSADIQKKLLLKIQVKVGEKKKELEKRMADEVAAYEPRGRRSDDMEQSTPEAEVSDRRRKRRRPSSAGNLPEPKRIKIDESELKKNCREALPERLRDLYDTFLGLKMGPREAMLKAVALDKRSNNE